MYIYSIASVLLEGSNTGTYNTATDDLNLVIHEPH
jgi:hypothetical protein